MTTQETIEHLSYIPRFKDARMLGLRTIAIPKVETDKEKTWGESFSPDWTMGSPIARQTW